MTESELEFKFTNQCAFEGCKQLATIWACGQKLLNTQGHPNPAKYCNDHAALVSDEDNPEYTVHCPKCHCRFGVN